MKPKLVLVCVVFAFLRVGAQPRTPPTGERAEVTFAGRINAGERYARRFGPDFEFVLQPDQMDASGLFPGWIVEIGRANGTGGLAELTIPLRGPRPNYLFASYLLPGANAPGTERVIAFAPDVGLTLTEDTLMEAAATGDSQLNGVLDLIYGFGRCELTIRDHALTKSANGDDVGFQWIDFRVRLSWPKSYNPRTFKPRQVR